MQIDRWRVKKSFGDTFDSMSYKTLLFTKCEKMYEYEFPDVDILKIYKLIKKETFQSGKVDFEEGYSNQINLVKIRI